MLQVAEGVGAGWDGVCGVVAEIDGAWVDVGGAGVVDFGEGEDGVDALAAGFGSDVELLKVGLGDFVQVVDALDDDGVGSCFGKVVLLADDGADE